MKVVLDQRRENARTELIPSLVLLARDSNNIAETHPQPYHLA